MSIQIINPTTGELIKEYPLMDKSNVNKIISLCHQDFLEWSRTPISKRAKKILTLTKLLKKNKEKYTKLMSIEMGKPVRAGTIEIEKCILLCDYYAKNAERMLEPKIIKTELHKSYVTFAPTGIIFAVMPWNFPFWQVLRFAVPNLIAGNGCLLKHASISTGTALEIENLFHEASLPTNIFRSLIINTNLVETVIANPKITGVTLTGSAHAGQSVASLAGKYLKKVVLELGGNDPYIILEDADLDLAANTCVKARLNNSGQVCIAAKRIIVVDNVFDKFQQKILDQIKHYKMGNPLDKNSSLGPLAREDLRENVHNQIKRSVELGAKLVVGGEIPQMPGYFYPPTLLTDVKPGTPAFDEEIFGPVICLTHAKDEKEAIRLANQSIYGLGAGIFTNDTERGEKIAASELNAGTCSVNTAVHSDPRLPFGGTKQSGFGRELGTNGLKSFLNIKTIQIL